MVVVVCVILSCYQPAGGEGGRPKIQQLEPNMKARKLRQHQLETRKWRIVCYKYSPKFVLVALGGRSSKNTSSSTGMPSECSKYIK